MESLVASKTFLVSYDLGYKADRPISFASHPPCSRTSVSPVESFSTTPGTFPSTSFPPIPLTSKHSLAYCSEDCQSLDTSSPSISSASSTLSSPSLGYATGGDIPALVPAALGSALTDPSSRRHGYYLSYSSASSTPWTALTDDDAERDVTFGLGTYGSHFHPSVDSLYDGSSKSANFAENFQKQSALSYARRPSETNNHSTVPNPHGRTSSLHVPHIPRSAPMHSHLSIYDDGPISDSGFSSREESDPEYFPPKPAMKPKRSRASLPGYFSLLQMSSPLGQRRFSSLSSSSENTMSRRSPSTPTVLVNGAHHSPPLSPSTIPSLSTPRGRRRTREVSRSSTHSKNYSSSRSRSRRPNLEQHASEIATFIRSSYSNIARGRTAVRKNGSPLPKMVLTDKERALESRGRPNINADIDAPGFGHGRSGLVDRERHFSRSTRVV